MLLTLMFDEKTSELRVVCLGCYTIIDTSQRSGKTMSFSEERENHACS